LGKCYFYLLTHDSILSKDLIFGPYMSHKGALDVAERSLKDPFKIETFGDSDLTKARAYFAPRFAVTAGEKAAETAKTASAGRSPIPMAALLIVFFLASAALGFGLCMLLQP